MLYRDDNGYTQARRAASMLNIRRMMRQGAQLGSLWLEGYFDVGDPLQPGASACAERLS